MEDSVKAIESWLKEANIPNAQQDHKTILRFLIGCKYDVPQVKIKMKNYYEMRRTCPELFHGRDPLEKNMERLLDLGAWFPLPVKDDQSRTLVVVKAAVNNPKTIPMTDVFRVGLMSVDLLMELDEKVVENGVKVIIDMTGASIGHALQMTPTLIRKTVRLWQDCYPIRIEGIDFINCPAGIDVVLNLFRQFMGENLKSKMRTHGKQKESLLKVIDARILPNEYGGTLGESSSIVQMWKKKVQAHRQWFLEDETIK